jgi:hypothetical protein
MTKETELCRYCHCPYFTSKSVTSSQGHVPTIAQTPKVNHEHITRIWHCTGTPTFQEWWRLECSSTKAQWWWSQHYPLPKGNFFGGSETVHAGNHNHKDSLAIHVPWTVHDSGQSLTTSHWSSGLSVGISRCSGRCTICMAITHWSIS